MNLREMTQPEIEKMIGSHLFNAGYFNLLDCQINDDEIDLTLQTRMFEPLHFTITVELKDLEENEFEDEKSLCEALKPLIVSEIHDKFFWRDDDIIFSCLCEKYTIDEDTLGDILDDYDAMMEYAKMYSDGNIEITVS